MTAGVAIDHVDQFGAVHVPEAGVGDSNRVEQVAAFLHHLNAAIADGFELSRARRPTS